MYAFIKGTLFEAIPGVAVVEAGGIGYRICIPGNVFNNLPQFGSQVFLHTSVVIREISQTIYGFLSPTERDIFETLMGVSGIGPKIALSVIGHLSVHDLQRAISQGDIAAISKVPGIGKKTAERLIIELRDKLTSIFPRDISELATVQLSDPNARKVQDAMSALINLGYNQQTAQKAIKKSLKDTSEESDLATLITTALKNI